MYIYNIYTKNGFLYKLCKIVFIDMYSEKNLTMPEVIFPIIISG